MAVPSESLHTKMRSWLFTPATRPERFENATKSGADVLIVDLEDSVAPDDKPRARENVRTLLAGPTLEGALLAVRINSPATRHGIDDLAALLDAARAPAIVILPKVETVVDVERLEALLESAGKAAALVPMIESPRGLFVVESITLARACVAGVMFGAADYASSAGVERSSLAMKLARCRIAAAAASAGVHAIDAPCFALHDASALEEELAFARANGFHAKAAIHPAHIEPINAAFTPSAKKVAWAKEVLRASAEGAAVAGDQMVDEAMAREARTVVADASPPEAPVSSRRSP
jgi:(S)-citramalyl-CoA lyase